MPEEAKPNDPAAEEREDAYRQAEPKGTDDDDAGEDEGSAAKEGSESHLKDDQKTMGK